MDELISLEDVLAGSLELVEDFVESVALLLHQLDSLLLLPDSHLLKSLQLMKADQLQQLLLKTLSRH